MGHGRKNTNRGEAIARNTERVRGFGRRLDLYEREARVLRALVESNQRINEIRLDLLERPIRRKIADWIRTTAKRIRDRIRPPAPEFARIPEEQLETTGTEKEPEIEIVPPPAEAEALARSADDALMKGNDDGPIKNEKGER